MVFHVISLYCVVLHGIVLYSGFLHGIALSCTVVTCYSAPANYRVVHLVILFIFVFVFVLVFSFLKSLILHHQEFKDRKYKTDPRDFKPYCFDCFEKLLGHYGDAHYG